VADPLLLEKVDELTPIPTRRFQKTRLAPTPSGFLHAGNKASFLITQRLARQTGARILLRIDDADSARARPAYIQNIFDTLAALDIAWDEGPRDAADLDANWSQRHRLRLYRNYLDRLRAGGHVYACTCSRTDVQRQGEGPYPGTCRHRGLSLDTPAAAWRLRTNGALALRVGQVDGSVIDAELPPEMHDVIIRKKDGLPAYQLSSVADDVHFGIDLIVRGEDLWHSTLVQLYIAQLLGLDSFGSIAFVHHPLVLDGEGRKISKTGDRQ
jgi:glutamyl/glutaminyl-tRNA synthetase